MLSVHGVIRIPLSDLTVLSLYGIIVSKGYCARSVWENILLECIVVTLV